MLIESIGIGEVIIIIVITIPIIGLIKTLNNNKK